MNLILSFFPFKSKSKLFWSALLTFALSSFHLFQCAWCHVGRLMMKKTQILLVTPGSEPGIDLLALPAGTGMAACSLWALPVQLHQLWWAQSWERTGTSASGHHPSLAELSELQCPSCLPSAAVLLAPALPKGFFYGERVWPLSLLAQHGSPGAELGAPGESLHSILSFPWFSASLWVSPLPFPWAAALGVIETPQNTQAWDLFPSHGLKVSFASSWSSTL